MYKLSQRYKLEKSKSEWSQHPMPSESWLEKEAWDDFKSTLASGIASIVDQQKRELINTDTQCAFLDAEIYGKIL